MVRNGMDVTPRALHAMAEIKARAAGGAGAAREFCELIMRAQGTLDQAQAAYL